MDKVKRILFKIRQFLEEARAELKKVTWPTRKQTLASTSVVLIVVIVVSMYLGLVDFGLAKIIKVLLG
jgi:preprotein translocase subunit SecE